MFSVSSYGLLEPVKPHHMRQDRQGMDGPILLPLISLLLKTEEQKNPCNSPRQECLLGMQEWGKSKEELTPFLSHH